MTLCIYPKFNFFSPSIRNKKVTKIDIDVYKILVSKKEPFGK